MSTDEVGMGVRERLRPERVHLRVLGADIAVDPATPQVREDILRQWARCLAPAKAATSGQAMTVEDDGDRAFAMLTSTLTRIGIEALMGEFLMFHAAGLAGPDGGVLVLVAESGTGKTTAARALATRGWGYVSDETIAISERGCVVPYPKPLSVTGPNGPGTHKVQQGPDDLGLARPPSDLTVSRIVLLDRVPDGTQPPELEPLPIMDALFALIPQTSALTRLPMPLQALCRCLDACGGAFRLRYTEVDDAIPLLEQLMGVDAVTDATHHEWLVDEVEGEQGMTWALRDGRVHHRPVDEVVRVGNEIVVLMGATPARLSGIGLTVWDAARSGATLAELTQAAIAAHGEHPEAAALVQHAVQDMVEADVLAWSPPQTVDEVLARDPG